MFFLSFFSRMPYLDFLIKQPSDWTLQTMALWHKSRLETDDTRAKHRCLMQMEGISAQYSAEAPAAVERQRHFYVMAVPTRWEIDVGLAEVSQATRRTAPHRTTTQASNHPFTVLAMDGWINA